MNCRHRRGPWRLLGSGSALPGTPVLTDELLQRIDARFGVNVAPVGRRLATRLGVHKRHFSRDFAALGESTRAGDGNHELAARAIRAALLEAKLTTDHLGYLLGHTTSPHTLLPSNVAWVADQLGFDGPYAELRQACTGFAHALMFATAMIHDQPDAPIAIVGSETGSVYLDPLRAARDVEQLLNLVQMGDGAGAVILGAAATSAGAANVPEHAPRIRDVFVGSLGAGKSPGFWLESGGSGSPEVRGIPHFRHDATSVRSMGEQLFDACISATRHLGLHAQGFDYVLPHQANARELPLAIAQRLNISPERVLVSGDELGNLGSASIWVGLDRARTSGRLTPGDRVLILGAEATKYLFGGFVYEHA